jgi:phosphoribosylaminoimidazole-succinocarboxamide synthase
MAKKKYLEETVEEVKELTSKSVKFLREFHGNLNNYSVDIPKSEVGKVKELPLLIYDWVQKFKVTEDA